MSRVLHDRPVEAVHALGVDERRADPQPHEERRRHAGAALVEELDHRVVRADGDDELARRARRPGAWRCPRSCPRSRTARRAGPSAVEPIRTGRLAVGVGVHDELGAAVHGRVGHRVEVADDDVGLEAELEQRVGAAVDADQHRLDLAEVARALQRGQVLAVVDAPHDDERVAVLERRPHVGAGPGCRWPGGARACMYSRVLVANRSSSAPEGVPGLLDVLPRARGRRGGRRWPAAPRPATPRCRRR